MNEGVQKLIDSAQTECGFTRVADGSIVGIGGESGSFLCAKRKIGQAVVERSVRNENKATSSSGLKLANI
jgi:hypothetical protein